MESDGGDEKEVRPGSRRVERLRWSAVVWCETCCYCDYDPRRHDNEMILIHLKAVGEILERMLSGLEVIAGNPQWCQELGT